jgi:hypothetical protein
MFIVNYAPGGKNVVLNLLAPGGTISPISFYAPGGKNVLLIHLVPGGKNVVLNLLAPGGIILYTCDPSGVDFRIA